METSQKFQTFEKLETTENKLILSKEDKEILLVLLPKFKEIEYYEISEIENLLKTIDAENNNNLHQWKTEIYNAARNGNEEKYLELLKMIEN